MNKTFTELAKEPVLTLPSMTEAFSFALWSIGIDTRGELHEYITHNRSLILKFVVGGDERQIEQWLSDLETDAYREIKNE